jgi:nucleotide-binding universal stress UspA family protein
VRLPPTHDHFTKGSITTSGMCRIVAGVSGSPGSVHALRQATDFARHHDALLLPLHTWVPPEGDRHERKHPCLELRQLWEDDAWQRLWQALDAAFGGVPAGVRIQPVVVRGKPGKALAGAACQPGDVLVIGTGRPGGLRRLWRCGVARYCLAHACCPVLAIPPLSLAQEAGRGFRGWAFRHRWAQATSLPA